MGIKKKKLRERARSDYLRFKNHAELSIEIAEDATIEKFKLAAQLFRVCSDMNKMREDHADAIRQAKEEAAGKFPVIVNARSFRDQIARLPRFAPCDRPHFTTHMIEVAKAPDHIPHRVGFRGAADLPSRTRLDLRVVEVVVPGMPGRSQFGLRIPAGVVLVEMDP